MRPNPAPKPVKIFAVSRRKPLVNSTTAKASQSKQPSTDLVSNYGNLNSKFQSRLEGGRAVAASPEVPDGYFAPVWNNYEDGTERRFQGEGRIGCVAGISLVAPFAVVTLDQIEVFENGSRSEPSVEPHIFGLDGRKVDVEEHYREMVDDEGLMLLRQLRSQIVRILNDFSIAVIPEEDLDRPVPWLRAGDEVFLGDTGESITVQQAFFFHGP